MQPASSTASGPCRRASAASERPSTSSITRYRTPSASPASKTATACGWVNEAAARASRTKRRRAAGSAAPRLGGSSLTATVAVQPQVARGDAPAPCLRGRAPAPSVVAPGDHDLLHRRDAMASAGRPGAHGYGAAMIRLRQVALVAADRDAVVAELCRLPRCHGVLRGPRRRRVRPAQRPDDDRRPVPRGRQPDRRRARRPGACSTSASGDGGYMAIFEVDDLDERVAALDELGVRIVWRARPPRHPRSPPPPPRRRRGDRVARPAASPTASWRWAGPWHPHAETSVVTAIAGIDVAADDPEAMAARWAELDIDHAVRFVAAGPRGEGIDAIDLVAADRRRVGATSHDLRRRATPRLRPTPTPRGTTGDVRRRGRRRAQRRVQHGEVAPAVRGARHDPGVEHPEIGAGEERAGALAGGGRHLAVDPPVDDAQVGVLVPHVVGPGKAVRRRCPQPVREPGEPVAPGPLVEQQHGGPRRVERGVDQRPVDPVDADAGPLHRGARVPGCRRLLGRVETVDRVDRHGPIGRRTRPRRLRGGPPS